MTTRITIQQLESYLWDAAVLLRGTIDAGDYKQFIMPLLFYKRLCDVFDEETQAALEESGGDTGYAAFPENHRFQIPPEAHWREIRKVSRDVGQALQVALRTIETANPDRLYGIFGDAQWTNKDRLSDATLRDLIEHFSSLELTVANLPEDELGNGYEYLIKKFADDSGHTAAEFYTNRTVVHLMTEMLQPQPGESIYDPTCGSGGMLLCSIAYLRHHGQEWRNVKLFGQERNLMTSSIARMNCFLHGIEDFRIERGDTLAEPKFVEGDKLKQFDVVLANPPYSIKQWDRSAFSADPWGRNFLGTPPQGRADYAFWQHILASMSPKNGRCAILFPHGVLFRQEEGEMRKKLIEMDLIECVLGLGPNLFYNSPMEACVVICRSNKPKERQGKILLINAVNEVTRERSQSYLTSEHIEKIAKVYQDFAEEKGFSKIVTRPEIKKKDSNLSISLYVSSLMTDNGKDEQFGESDHINAFTSWMESSRKIKRSISDLVEIVQEYRNVDQSSAKEKKHLISDKFLLPNPKWDLLPIFDRLNWQRVSFGDVVNNLSETEQFPKKAGIDRFIGLEHLEPGSLHIQTWGDIADGTTFTRRCRPHQVLFGKRRAYQRKVAVADFNAVVSGDIYVFAPKDERLLPEFLPLICISDRFFKYAVETSSGSLSPRTSWSHLTQFQFNLPPIDQQHRIAAIFWTIDRLVGYNDQLLKCLSLSLNAFVCSLTDSKALKKWSSRHLVDCMDIVSGQVDPKEEPYRSMILVAPNHVEQGTGSLLNIETAVEQYSISGKHLFKVGDVVYSKIRPSLRKCFIAPFDGLCSADMYPLRPKSEMILPRYLLAILLGDNFTSFAESRCVRTGIPKINRIELAEYSLPIPDIKEQEKICDYLNQLDEVMLIGNEYKNTLNRILSNFLFLLFGDPNDP